MVTLLHELRFALRQIRKSPGFAATVILTMAIGIGANTAMFTVMDAVVLRPLALPDLQRVVTVTEERSDHEPQAVAMGNFTDWQRQSQSFSEMAVQNSGAVNLTGSGDPEHLQVTLASANLFHLLGVEPWIGRTFLPHEDEPGREQEAVLSYPFWQKHFSGDRSVTGRSLELDGKPYLVVGVMPQGFHYASASDLFLPLALTDAEKADRNKHSYSVLARLRPGVTKGSAEAELQSIAARLAAAHPQSNLGWTSHVQLLADSVNGDYTPMYMRLMMGVGIFVLLIICANISNLQFSRSLSRRTEIAIRSAMGASRGRILRQLLIESVLLSLVGAAAGIFVALLQLHLTLISMPPHIARYMPGWSNIALNGRALAYSLGLSIAAGVIAGIVPSLAAMRIGVAEQLKAGGRSVTGDRRSHRLRNAFAVAQITLSVTLVAGAALMTTGMRAMLRQTDRYSPQHLLKFDVDLPSARYATAAERKAFYDRALDAVRATPGVAAADLTQALPYNNTGVWWQDLGIEHLASVPGEFRNTQRVTVSPDYLGNMHIGLISGRYLNSSDGASAPVAVVSRKLAERDFPGQQALGQKIRLGKDADATPWITIVGIVEDVTLLWIDKTPQPVVYLSYTQFPTSNISFAVRTSGDPMTIAPAIRSAVSNVDATLPLDNLQTYDAFLHEALIGLSYVVVMFAVDAAIALFLSSIGIFGVMANAVTERTHEIGVRVALGAEPSQIRLLMMRRGALLTLIGLALGIPLAMGLARTLANLVFGISSADVMVFGLTGLAVAGVSALATLLPAQRAASVQPMSALRNE